MRGGEIQRIKTSGQEGKICILIKQRAFSGKFRLCSERKTWKTHTAYLSGRTRSEKERSPFEDVSETGLRASGPHREEAARRYD